MKCVLGTQFVFAVTNVNLRREMLTKQQWLHLEKPEPFHHIHLLQKCEVDSYSVSTLWTREGLHLLSSGNVDLRDTAFPLYFANVDQRHTFVLML